jgi:hypothetical protein
VGIVLFAFPSFSVLACIVDELRLAGMGDLPLYWMFDLSIRLSSLGPVEGGPPLNFKVGMRSVISADSIYDGSIKLNS